ncbi:hypothetical protein [Amycolatopsis sp. NBC_00438]|uniref:hypothetical protein n=1 Tax=Amycolatopsis sp. NBC_00438 TaxID=2903558 RepID=UPI002E1ED6AE
MTDSDVSIRRSTIERIPLFRRGFRPEPRRHLPRWVRRLLLGIAAAAMFAAVLVSCNESRKPASLAASTLQGPRLVTGRICIEEAVDVSSSMEPFTAPREVAERELFTFARRELRPDDQLAEAFFAGSGEMALRPAALSTLSAPAGIPAGIDYNGTNLLPAVDKLDAARNGQQCAARALVVITDGVLGDEAVALGRHLRESGYTRVFAVIPTETGWGRPDQLSGSELASVSVYHFTGSGLSGRIASIVADAKPLDVVFGDIISSLTGQTLSEKDN